MFQADSYESRRQVVACYVHAIYFVLRSSPFKQANFATSLVAVRQQGAHGSARFAFPKLSTSLVAVFQLASSVERAIKP